MGADTDRLERQILDGDADAFADVLRRSTDRLRRMIDIRLDRRIAGRVDAADVLQDVFAEATARLGEYRRNHPMTVFLWLRFLAKQRLQQVHRFHLGAEKRDARLESPWSKQGSATSALALEFTSTGTTPSQANVRRESIETVREAIEKLTDDEREILTLRHYDELSNAEAARELELSESGASYRYVQALLAFRKAVEELVGPDAESRL